MEFIEYYFKVLLGFFSGCLSIAELNSKRILMIPNIKIPRKRSSHFTIKLHVSNFVSFYETGKKSPVQPRRSFR